MAKSKKRGKKGGFMPMDFLIVGGIAAVAYFLFSSFSRGPIQTPALDTGTTPNPQNNTTGGGTTTQSTGTQTTINDIYFNSTERSKVLKKGDSGNEVKALQLYLKIAGKNLGVYGADGVFGTDTENALRSFGNTTSTTLDTLGIESIKLSTGQVYGKNPFDIFKKPAEWTNNGWV